MFVHTDEGRAILDRAIDIDDEVIGVVPVIQPTDFVILKLMAIANNSDRITHDLADLEILFKAIAQDLLNKAFDPIDVVQLQKFADKFEVSEHLRPLLARLNP